MTVATKYCLSYMWQDVLTYFYFPKTDAWGLTSASTVILFVTKAMFNLQRCKKEKKKQPFLSCTVTYLLLLGKAINIFLLWTNLGAQPCKEGSSRHVGNISVWHCSWSRDVPVYRSSAGALALQRSGVWPSRHSQQPCAQAHRGKATGRRPATSWQSRWIFRDRSKGKTPSLLLSAMI